MSLAVMEEKALHTVKRHNDVTYYLEQVSDDAKTLSNKQMVKVSTGTIPSLPGLRNAINKKWNLDSPPDDAAVAVPRMYVQDVQNQVPNASIASKEKPVNPSSVDASKVSAVLQSAAKPPGGSSPEAL